MLRELPMAVRFLGFADLKAMKGIRWSRMHIDRLERAGLFPKRIHLGPKTVAWAEDEIDAFAREKLNHREEAA
jgi:prophage regulatory protein